MHTKSNGVEFDFENCPACHGGKLFDSGKGVFLFCLLCYGKGTVITDHICACGKPCGTLSDDKILFCGQKQCLLDLRADEKEAKNPLPSWFDSSRAQWNRAWDGYDS